MSSPAERDLGSKVAAAEEANADRLELLERARLRARAVSVVKLVGQHRYLVIG